MLTIYIIESNHDYLVQAIETINTNKDYKVIGTLQDGLRMKERLAEIIKADIVLIDESVKNMTPTLFISAYNTELVKRPSGARSIKAILTDSITPKMEKRYLDMGYQATIDKSRPLVDSVDELARLYAERQNRVTDYERYISHPIDIPDFHRYLTEILHQVGIPASLKGYMYLRRAIEIAFLCLDTVVGGVTKVIYPAVAETYSTTPSRVERAMRHAIETGWMRGNVDVIEKIFSYSYSSEKGKPTNGEFIANIADHLAVKFRDWQRKLVDEIEGRSIDSPYLQAYTC